MRLLVVGGGPAGLAAAMQARELGADVTLLEAEQVGGTNLNHGPAPVRTLARAARLARDWSSWERFGLEGPRPVPNLDAVLANSRPGRPLRPRQERHRWPPAPQRDRPDRAPWPRPVHRPAHRARRRRPQLARRPHRHRGRLPCGSAAGPGRRARADLSRHLDPQSPAAPGHGHRRGRHRLPDSLDLRRPRSRCPAHRSRSPARARR